MELTIIAASIHVTFQTKQVKSLGLGKMALPQPAIAQGDDEPRGQKKEVKRLSQDILLGTANNSRCSLHFSM